MKGMNGSGKKGSIWIGDLEAFIEAKGLNVRFHKYVGHLKDIIGLGKQTRENKRWLRLLGAVCKTAMILMGQCDWGGRIYREM